MLLLVEIDLSQADLSLFEGYEDTVLKLLDAYGGRLEFRVRSDDQSSETHLLFFNNRASFESFLADPTRVELSPQWEACKATAKVSEVRAIG